MALSALRPMLAAASLAAAVAAAGSVVAQTPARPASTAAHPTPGAEARSPRAAVEAFEAALEAGDAAAATALLAEDATVFESGHVERSRAEYVAHHLPADIRFSKAVPSTVTARHVIMDGGMAVVTSETRTTGTFEGKPVDSLGIGTIVLRRGPGGWRIVHIHWSSRKAPTS